jgi:hypothetical protein
MAGDSLREILEIARREMTDVPPEVWARLEGLIRLNFGAQRLYIASQKKTRHLDALSAADCAADIERMAQILKLSPRRAV